MSPRRSLRLSSTLRQEPTRYEPTARIAAGGMAEVWRAKAYTAEGNAFDVAIKRVLPQMRDPMYRAMMEDEARLGMLLRHPNIVRVYDARDVGGTYIMVMELVEGETLKELLQLVHAQSRALPTPCALYIALKLLSALAYVHDLHDDAGKHLGIVHRDVSPHNLLLSQEGHVKLTDFGLADASVHANQQEGMVGGKLAYLAPETVLNQVTSDRSVDLFAAGVVLWEMLSGASLFQRETDRETIQAVAQCSVPVLSARNPTVPFEVDRFLAGLLAKDPARRYKSAAQATRVLASLHERYAEGSSVTEVATIVRTHLGLNARRSAPPELSEFDAAMAELFAHQLAQFVEMAGGAEPLDPSDFDLG